MKKLEYLKRVINETELLGEKTWYVTVFARLLPSDESRVKDLPHLGLIRLNRGLFAVSKLENETELLPIEDDDPKHALFRFSDEIEIDNSWIKSVKGKQKTKIGNLVINKLVFEYVVGDRIPYMDGEIDPSRIEKVFISKVKDNPGPNDISVDEMVEIIDRLYFLTNLSFLSNISATEKSITAPPGLEKKKQELIKKYEGQLTDQVKLVELEKELMEYDREYLKDDPTLDKVLSGKALKARKKQFLLFGYDKGFTDEKEIHPVLSSLEQGLELDPKVFADYMNSLRYGSYARGALTADSGYQTKILLRSLGNIEITPNDCGTKKGIVRSIDKTNYKQLIGREVKKNNTWTLIESESDANNYINKDVEIRSALYCKQKGTKLCYHCLNAALKNQPNAILYMSVEVSATLMTMFLKLMHDTTVRNVDIELKDMIT